MWCGPKQLEHLGAKQHGKEGTTQWPPFQDLQIVSEDDAPQAQLTHLKVHGQNVQMLQLHGK